MAMIHPLIPQGCFDPEATKIMGDLFDDMIRSLEQFGRPRIIQEAIARHVIAVARCGERDPEVIWERCSRQCPRPRRGKPRGRRPSVLTGRAAGPPSEVCYPFCRKHGRRQAVIRREFITLLGANCN